MTKKRKILLTILLILICGLITFSTAYIISISNDGIVYSTKGKAKSGTPNITFTGENTSLSIQNAYPVNDMIGLNSTPYSFSVINNEKKYNVGYEIYLETMDGTGGYLSDNLVKFSLKDSQTSGTILGNLTSSNPTLSSEGYTKSYLIATGVVANTKFPTDSSEESISYTNYVLNEETLNTTKNYNMRLWIDESATVENAANKTWSGKLVIKYNYELPDENQSTTDTIFTGYTEVAYLQSSGHQYIDTAYIPNGKTKIEMIYTDRETTNGVLFGAYADSSWTNNSYGLYNNMSGSSPFWIHYNCNISSQYTTYPNSVNIIFDKGNLFINGVQYYIATEVTISLNKTLYLLNGNGTSTQNQPVSLKLLKFTIWDNNSLQKDLTPCIRKSDSKPGMCDKVTQSFFSNQGTGEFGYETLDGIYIAPQ